MKRKITGYVLMGMAIVLMAASFFLLAGEVPPGSDMTIGTFLSWKLLGGAGMAAGIICAKAVLGRFPEIVD